MNLMLDLVAMVVGDTPFYTNVTNPYNLTLNENESQLITWHVNATGDLNSTHEFFVYVNKTADLSISNITKTINVTIVSLDLPTINFVSPTTSSESLSQNYVAANISAGETNFVNLTIYLYNSSGLYNYSNSSSSEYYVVFSNLPDGTYYLNATTVNTFGTENNAKTRTITLDTIAPLLEVTSPVDGYNLSSNTLEFTFVATESSTTNCSIFSDQEGSISYVLRDSNSSITSGITTTLNISNFEVRSHSWYITCTDSVGNSNTSSTRQFTVDNSAPSIILSSPTEDSSAGSIVYIYTEITDSLTAIDQVSYTIYNGSALGQSLVTGSLNLSNNWDATWNSSSYGEVQMNLTLVISANDTGGNLASENVTFYLDNVNPVIQLIEPSELLTYYKTNFSLNAIVQDLSLNYTNYSIRSNSVVQQNFSSYGTPVISHTWNDLVNVTGLSEGPYNLTVFGKDISSNSRIVSTLFIIDRTAPQLTLHNPSGIYSNSNSVLFNFTVVDNISSTLECNISIGGNTPTIYCLNSSSCDYTFTGFSDLLYNYSLFCQDNASNVVGYSSNITIDTTSPQIVFNSQTSSGNLSQNYLVINVSVVDQNLASISNNFYNLAGSLINTSSSSSTPFFVNLTGLSSGTYYFNSTATDLAGNIMSTATRTVILDVIIPTNSLSANSTNLQKNVDSVIINWSVSDNNINIIPSSLDPNQVSLSDSSESYGDAIIVTDGSSTDNLNTVIFNITSPNGALLFKSSERSGEIVFTPDNLTSMGTYLASLYSVDNAGNQNSTNLTVLVNDTTVPTVNLINPLSGNYAQNWIFVNITSTDEDVNSITIYLYNNIQNLVEQDGGFSSPYNYNFTSLDDGTYYYNVTVCDSNQCNSSETKTVLLDTTGPETTLNYPESDYVNSSSNIVNVLFNCSAADSLGLINISLYITNNQNIAFTFNQSANISGTSNSTTWNLNLSPGNHTWNCLGTDILGNSLFALGNKTVFINFTDTDNDGTKDEEDLLEGNESNVIKSGIGKLNISVGRNSTFGTYNDVRELIFSDLGIKMINFTHNFTASQLDLSKITIIKNANYLIVNLSQQLQSSYNKTLYLENNEFISLCVKDAEINSISEVSSSCNGANETDLTDCLTTNITLGFDNTTNTTNLIGCDYDGNIFTVTNLQYSAIKGTVATPASADAPAGVGGAGGGGGGGGGGGSAGAAAAAKIIECYTDADCDSEKTCYQNRCVKLFDAKIIDVASPIGDDGYLDFTYFIKGMANINSDVIVNFWLEKDGQRVSSGQDVIYLGSFEEKTEQTKIFVPQDLTAGAYEFYVQVSLENYAATAHRTVYVEQGEQGREVSIGDSLVGKAFGFGLGGAVGDYNFVWLSLIIMLFIAFMVIIFHRNRTKLKQVERWIKQHKLLILAPLSFIILVISIILIWTSTSVSEGKINILPIIYNVLYIIAIFIFVLGLISLIKRMLKSKSSKKVVIEPSRLKIIFNFLRRRRQEKEQIRIKKIREKRMLFADKEQMKQEARRKHRKFFHDYFGMFKTEKEKEEINRAKLQKIARKRIEEIRKQEEKLREQNKAKAEKRRKQEERLREENKARAEKLRKDRKVISEERNIIADEGRRKQEAKRSHHKFFHDHFGMFKTDQEKAAIRRAKEQKIARKQNEKRNKQEEKLRERNNALAKKSREKRKAISEERNIFADEKRRKQEVIRNHRKFFHDNFGMFKTNQEKVEIKRAKERKIAQKRNEKRRKQEKKLQERNNALAKKSRERRERLAKKKYIKDAIQRRKQEIKRNRRKFFHDTFGLFKTEKEKEEISRAKEQKIAKERRINELKRKQREEKRIRKQEDARQKILVKEKLKQFEEKKKEESKVKEEIEKVKSITAQKRKALIEEERIAHQKLEAIREEQRRKRQMEEKIEEERLKELKEREKIKKEIEREKERIIKKKLKER